MYAQRPAAVGGGDEGSKRLTRRRADSSSTRMVSRGVKRCLARAIVGSEIDALASRRVPYSFVNNIIRALYLYMLFMMNGQNRVAYASAPDLPPATRELVSTAG
jgi:hypothetical protein